MTLGTLLGAGDAAEFDYRHLASMDWNFAHARTGGATHAIHPYPAKFIPQIPRALIAALGPKDGTAVLDPFCGSGTALVEAAVAGLPAIGIDLHPLACLISKVKVTPLSASVADAAARVICRAPEGRPELVPEIPALDHWFRRDIQLELAAILTAVAQEPDKDLRDALRVAASSIIVRVSLRANMRETADPLEFSV